MGDEPAVNETFTLHFTLTEADIVAWVAHCLRERKPQRLKRWFEHTVAAVLCFTPLCVVAVEYVLGNPFSFNLWLALLLGLGGLGYFSARAIHQRPRPGRDARRWMQEACRGQTEVEMTVTIAPQHFGYRWLDSEIKSGWRYIVQIRDDGGFVALLWDDGGLFIPHRCFSDAGERERLVACAEAYRAAAPPPSSQCPECGYALRGQTSDGCPECGWRKDGHEG